MKYRVIRMKIHAIANRINNATSSVGTSTIESPNIQIRYIIEHKNATSNVEASKMKEYIDVAMTNMMVTEIMLANINQIFRIFE